MSYSLVGTAVAGTDYTALPTAVTISTGMTSATILVNPLEDTQAASSPTLQLALNAAAGYTLGNPAAATVTIEELTPYQNWATSTFASAAANLAGGSGSATSNLAVIGSETADPNHNGVPNLLEYAFNANPLQTGTEPLPVVATMAVGNDDYLAITYTMLTNAPNLTYTVQVTSDLSGATDTWHSAAGDTTVVQQTSNGATTQVTVRDNTPVSSTPHRFIRLQVGENQP